MISSVSIPFKSLIKTAAKQGKDDVGQKFIPKKK
jgi:hypothetical protein